MSLESADMDVTDADATDAPPTAAAGTDDAAAETQLDALAEFVFQAQSDVQGVEDTLNPSKTPSDESLRQLATRIPVLNGEIEKLQLRVDAVAVGSADARARRRTLTEQTAALAERVHSLPSQLQAAVGTAAEAHKSAGNAQFKKGAYDAALASYASAIGVDRKNPVYYSNRCACHMAKGSFEAAAADAKECVSLDVGYEKGYALLIKCQLRLGEVEPAARTLQSAPLALSKTSDALKELSATVCGEVKGQGNASLKAGALDEAIRWYSLAIELDGTEPVYYSNRSAAYQAKQLWREAAADARSAIKADRLFVKGYMHLGKVPLALLCAWPIGCAAAACVRMLSARRIGRRHARAGGASGGSAC